MGEYIFKFPNGSYNPPDKNDVEGQKKYELFLKLEKIREAQQFERETSVSTTHDCEPVMLYSPAQDRG